MPSVTHDHTIAPPSKKRRRDDEHDFEPYQLPYNLEGLTARHNPYITADDHNIADRVLAERTHDNFGTFASNKLHPSPVLRKMIALRTPNKKARISGGGGGGGGEGRDVRSPPRQSRTGAPPPKEPQDAIAHTRYSPGRKSAVAVLRLGRCHICHRRPTKTSDLDDFADCEGCGQRTCFVCIRQCSGWLHRARTGAEEAVDLSASVTMEDAVWPVGGGGRERDGSIKGTVKRAEDSWTGKAHRQTICSRCCVERGHDGDVVCFGCLAFQKG